VKRKVLLLDYSVDESETPLIRRWIRDGFEVEVFAPLRQSGFPRPGAHDRVIHTGSSLSITGEAPFQASAEDFIRRSVDAGVPQMGICYGHQLLVRALLGREAVRRNPSGVEVGWGRVHFSPDAAGRIGVPRLCRIFQYHFDEVVSLPDGAVVAGWSEHTLIQAFVDEQLRLFGVQFHPEFDGETGNRHFLKDSAAIAAQGASAEEIVREGPEPPADGRFFGFFLSDRWESR
jgi:GMP synthase-like glutamine amidotransferase